jgi:hypothetical protein
MDEELRAQQGLRGEQADIENLADSSGAAGQPVRMTRMQFQQVQSAALVGQSDRGSRHKRGVGQWMAQVSPT